MSAETYPSNVTRFLERVDSVVETIKGHKGKVRVVSHYDGDGICAAALMTMALREVGASFHTTMVRSLDKNDVRSLASEQNKLIVFCDIGSGQIDILEQLESNVVVCDHHRPIRESKKIVQLNPHLFDIDGTYEACGSTLAFLVAERMMERPEEVFGVALAGILADRQHLGGITGLNKTLLDRYVEKGAVKVERFVALEGANVLEAVRGSLEPFFRGLSGRADAVRSFLGRLGISPDAKVEELHQEKVTALASMLVIWMLKDGVRPGTCEDFIIDRFWLDRFGLHARQLAAIVNACGRRGEEDTGLAICMGSKEALERGHGLREEHRNAIREALLALEKDGPKAMSNVQYIYCDDPARAGALAGLSMNYLFRQDKPTIALSRTEREVKVSTRGTRWLVSRGLDLAEGCRIAAERVKGHGGGHPIAAGATIPLKAEARFLKALDSVVGEQLVKNRNRKKG